MSTKYPSPEEVLYKYVIEQVDVTGWSAKIGFIRDEDSTVIRFAGYGMTDIQQFMSDPSSSTLPPYRMRHLVQVTVRAEYRLAKAMCLDIIDKSLRADRYVINYDNGLPGAAPTVLLNSVILLSGPLYLGRREKMNYDEFTINFKISYK